MVRGGEGKRDSIGSHERNLNGNLEKRFFHCFLAFDFGFWGKKVTKAGKRL